MRVGDARQIARDWVHDAGRRRPGVVGAYLAGSVNWLADDDDLPATSDLDVNLVVDAHGALPDRHKLPRDGVLLEVSYLPLDLLRSPEQVLGDFALAGGFRVPSVLFDRRGHLTTLQAAVARQFAEPAWVRRRCAHARGRLLAYLDGLAATDPIHDRAIRWLFGVSIATLLPLIADLRNPTVRRRYAAAHEVLADHGALDLYDALLDQLGCAAMSRRRVERHLAALAVAFDAASAARRSPFPFGTDISALARPAAIDGSRALIEQGQHREAVFWIGVTWSRCLAVLAADAPAEQERFAPAYADLLADLGIPSLDAMARRAERVRAGLPRISAIAEQIIAAR